MPHKPSQSRRADDTRVLRVQSVPVRAADRVVVAIAIILASVNGIALAPSLRVEAAVRANGVVVLGQDVRVEEVAGIVGSVRARVVVVVLRLGFAGCGTLARVVRARVDLHSDVGRLAVLDGGVDCAAEFSWAGLEGDVLAGMLSGLVRFGIGLTKSV